MRLASDLSHLNICNKIAVILWISKKLLVIDCLFLEKNPQKLSAPASIIHSARKNKPNKQIETGAV